ncbi:MAG: FtsX-like permease family protein [Alphaproteobacteria bacterium]|nr:FtsX-like permease family protein [Alphaproteobacteria bacterium]
MIWTTLQLAWRELRANFLRSILTTLGIIVGVAAVVIVVTLGQGLTLKVTSDISAMGRNMLFVLPFVQQRAGPATPQTPFKIADADAIKREIVGVAAVAPAATKQVKAVYGANNWSVTVTGTTNDFFIVRDWGVAEGRMFTESELRGGRPVCILGVTTKKQLFGSQNPLGAKIRVSTTACEVIGLLAEKGQSTFGQDQDDTILMPIAAVQRRLTGSDDVQQIFVSAASAQQIHSVQSSIEALMRERRRIRAGEQENFLIRDIQSISSLVQSTTTLLTAGLSAVAAISLLVGGIGIMNIMLVSVTERTREIGIRLAIGALERDVLLQFLIEAVLLSCIGGLIGALLGLGTSALIAYAIGVPFVLSPWVVVVSFVFSAAVGIVFGFFPARRAAGLDPIEALRYE